MVGVVGCVEVPVEFEPPASSYDLHAGGIPVDFPESLLCNRSERFLFKTDVPGKKVGEKGLGRSVQPTVDGGIIVTGGGGGFANRSLACCSRAFTGGA